jgi:hypothetical protein
MPPEFDDREETVATELTLNISPDRPGLTRLVALSNRVGWQVNGKPDTCVLTSATLHEILIRAGIGAEFLRVRAAVHCSCGSSGCAREHYGCVLGGDGDGSRLPAAKPGAWHGHLIVIALGRYLLDATLDQVNRDHPWLEAEPFVSEVTSEFLRGSISLFATTGKASATVAYSAFPGRGGFKSAPDMRPRARRDRGKESATGTLASTHTLERLIAVYPEAL